LAGCHRIPRANWKKYFREFALEFQDSQLAYLNTSKSTPKPYEEYNIGPVPRSGWFETDVSKVVKPPIGKGEVTQTFAPR